VLGGTALLETFGIAGVVLPCAVVVGATIVRDGWLA
jgi:hypothetical protein